MPAKNKWSFAVVLAGPWEEWLKLDHDSFSGKLLMPLNIPWSLLEKHHREPKELQSYSVF